MRLLALVLVATLTVSCTRPPSTSGEGAGGAAAPQTGDTTTTSLGRLGLEQVSLEFSGCMREHDISIPDLRLDAAARPVLDDLAAAVDTSSQEFRDALAACAVILTSAGALDLRGDPELRAAILEDLAAFAACARAEGLVDFPDPDLSFDGTGPAFATDALPLAERRD